MLLMNIHYLFEIELEKRIRKSHLAFATQR